ncbi:DNA polymerase delta subunit 3-like [Pectinophora gossypiella]|uniref:DNA polymerase delta subunit 3-like n=1 Tax=Pectinophora gossypiella TaxID=13191 RepID=UPI00214EB245|nr:DNA polymerase delta subunit 3-like [Pectinophora gossypiella]
MDENMIETNLNMIKEMILDEEKLVTYVSISKDLCIHVNDSKQLLTQFVEDIKKKQPKIDLNVNYILSGITGDNKARTTVVSDKEVEDIKKSFKNVFYVHIYSVNRGLPSVDNVAFMAVNKFEDYPLYTGLIKSSTCIKRTSDEIGGLILNNQQNIEIEQKPNSIPQKKINVEAQKKSTDLKNLGAHVSEDKSVTKVHESKSEPSIKKEVVSPKKDLSNNTKSKPDKKNGAKSQKGIAGFFNKSNSMPNKVTPKDKSPEKKEVVVKKEPFNKSDHEEMSVEVEKMDVDEEVEKKVKQPVIKKEQVNGKSKNKSLTEIKKTAKVDKKRKRVLHVSDSESDEDKDPFADEPEGQESEDEIPPTPAINTVKITSGLVNPKKRRKIVDKTYTDEDGYILTKKEEVYESCSDNEEETSTKENIQNPPANTIKQEVTIKEKKSAPKANKKVSPPQKGKQATLMNFFKKV